MQFLKFLLVIVLVTAGISSQPVTVVAESQAVQEDPIPTGTIEVFDFRDVNEDTFVSQGENGIGSVKITIIVLGATELTSTLTNSSGFATFEGLFVGDYGVCETPPEGMEPTNGQCINTVTVETNKTTRVNIGNSSIQQELSKVFMPQLMASDLAK